MKTYTSALASLLAASVTANYNFFSYLICDETDDGCECKASMAETTKENDYRRGHGGCPMMPN